MRRMTTMATALAILLVGTAWAGLFPAGFSGFSAEFTEKGSFGGQKMETTGKVWVAKDRFRQDRDASGQMPASGVIVRVDRDVVVTLMHDQRMYMEMKGQKGKPQEGMPSSDEELAKVAQRVDLGTETVAGYPCDKVKWVYRDKAQGTVIQWTSKKLLWPLKMEMESPQGRMSIEYRNVKEGAPPASMFEVPAGYSRFAVPSMPSGFKIPGM